MCVSTQVRANGQGSMCNQAIMLITDGAMEDYESVFEEFNWPERRVRTRLRTIKCPQQNVTVLVVFMRPFALLKTYLFDY